MIDQKSNEWISQRLGMFTASKFGKLLNTKRGGVGFGDTAMSYIYEVAAERQLKKQFLSGDGFDLYLSRTEKKSKSLEWGNDYEDMAREAFENILGKSVEKAEFTKINGYMGGSPDGKRDAVNLNGTFIGKIPVEIKCPYNPATYAMYWHKIKKGRDLLDVDKDYYCQCMGHIMALDSELCDFVAFDFMNKMPVLYVPVERDDDIVGQLFERGKMANELVEEIINN